LLIFKK